MNRRTFLSAAPVAALPLAVTQTTGSAAPVGFHRLSVEEDDPGFIPYGHLLGDKRMPRIFLDGIEQRPITVDAKEGWVKRYIRTERGNVAQNGRRLLTEIVHGNVTIEIPD